MKEFFVYILQSEVDPEKIYVGFTEHIEQRLEDHNSKSQIYSRRYAPWQLVTYIVFSSRESALAFEKYLKTPSGKAFLRKRLL